MEYPVLDTKATGARIKELRLEHHLKVEDVARFMGFESDQAVYKWQRGDSLPTVDNLYALSKLFETSVDDILRGREEKDESPSLSFCINLIFEPPVYVFPNLPCTIILLQ
jgi:transcriptional regulator with XRE-family HTH domain